LGIQRGRIDLEIRKHCIELIQEAEIAGARRSAAAEVLGLNLRRLQRWEKDSDSGDKRQGPNSVPAHALSEEEKKMIIEVCNSENHKDDSPWQIVAKLADSGKYLASESSFYRVLKADGLLQHRSKAKPRTNRRPPSLVARSPGEVWSWDITYLKSPVKGSYYYLYLIEDVFSRKIVGWAVYETESADLAAVLIDEACKNNGIMKDRLILHSDNGSPMRGATMLATLQRLGVVPSFSRPSVSDDNPYSEALFRTLKYRPSFPDGVFLSIEEARLWVEKFVHWYNTEHLHSGIKFVTPESRHKGEDIPLLNNRTLVYKRAREKNPSRWSRNIRNWSRVDEVYLNPRKEDKKTTQPDLTIRVS
jgi:putative transposase